MSSTSDLRLWNSRRLAPILAEVSAIHADMLQLEREYEGRLAEIHPAFRESARNLVHYLALRRRDLRGLQEQLAMLGLSSLGRTESHVRAALEAVLRVLHHLSASEWEAPEKEQVIDFAEGKGLLRKHTAELLGTESPQRGVRIMVTMLSEAADDYNLVRDLLAQGMDVMRVNCAHDGPEAWKRMVENLRWAEKEVGRSCRVQMDIAGAELRTGSIDPRSQIVKWRPQRDLCGRVSIPAHIWLTSAEQPESAPANGLLLIQRDFLARLQPGDRLKFRDLRGKMRVLEVQKRLGTGCWGVSAETVYLPADSDLKLTCVPKVGEKLASSARVQPPLAAAQFILLAPGDRLILTRSQAPGQPAKRDEQGRVLHPATIPCTIPDIFSDVHAGDRIWFDDGKIGGVIDKVADEGLLIHITSAKLDLSIISFLS